MSKPTHIKTWTKPKIAELARLLAETEGETVTLEGVEFTRKSAAWIVERIGVVLNAGANN